jgi:transcriptional regulator with PAS, ATPase and Fis domain
MGQSHGVTERDPGAFVRRVSIFWPGGSRVVDLPARGALTIGRTRSADLTIEHTSVSRKHAVLHVAPTGVRVEDCGSMNGTRVGGKKLKERQIVDLAPGTVIEIGKAMLVVQGDAPPSAREDDEEAPPPSFVVRDGSMARLHRLVDMVAKSDISVLLYGETGAGKEVFAQTIHKRSPRGAHPFVGLNCAALPENLLESELFGYERGAFTGAVQPKAGLLESAQGGSVFLDEIGEMPLAAQAKLLRTLERREVIRLGATVARPIDVRFISATHRNLEEQSARGLFRQDLFFRLDGISVQIPPLRERRSEIAPLAKQFVNDVARRTGTKAPSIAEDAFAALHAHTWPGNIRELRNVIERAVLLAGGLTIRAEHVVLRTMSMTPDDQPQMARTGPLAGGPSGYLPPPGPMHVAPTPAHAQPARPFPSPAGADASGPITRPALDNPAREQTVVAPYHFPAISGLNQDIAELERQRILDALERTDGNQKEAAALLGISRRTLISRLDEYKVPRPRKR